jgi:hypothetical protein
MDPNLIGVGKGPVMNGGLMTETSVAAGWYADPGTPGQLR